jgi:hypothetical protein
MLQIRILPHRPRKKIEVHIPAYEEGSVFVTYERSQQINNKKDKNGQKS